MARRQVKPAAVRANTADGFQNFAARTGVNTGNLTDASGYGFSPVSRNRVQMEFVYRSSWIAGQAVDTYAEDMTRQGIELKGDIEPDVMEALGKAAGRMQLWDGICDIIKWSRLYGGCIGVLMIDGQDVSTPLNLDTIRKGQFKGILPLDRWVVQPSLQDLVTEMGPDLGKPKFYTVIADAQALVNQKIHYSRVIRVDGVELPYWQKIAENGWGQSVLERLWDRLIAFDSATQGTAQLVFKAHLRTYSVDGLREIIAMGGKAYEGLVKQIDLIRLYQSNEGLTLMDAKDKFEAHQYSFGGLDSVMLQFMQQISGALGIPLVRLLGQSPAGLNSTGESDIRNYYDNVKQQQARKLNTGVRRLYDVLYRSEIGSAPPASFDFEFKPLWQLSDVEKADIAGKVATAIVSVSDIISHATALKELRQSSHTTGIFSNVTDEDIAAASEDLPPGPEDLTQEDDGQTQDGMPTFDGEHWITVSGARVLIDEHGEVLGGAGGKLNGKTLDPKTKSANRINEKTSQFSKTDFKPHEESPKSRPIEHVKADMQKAHAEYVEREKLVSAAKRNDRVQNEGGGGYSHAEVLSEKSSREYEEKMAPLRKELFAATWTPEVTKERRATMNREVVKTKNYGEVAKLQTRLGYTISEVKEAMKMRGIT